MKYALFVFHKPSACPPQKKGERPGRYGPKNLLRVIIWVTLPISSLNCRFVDEYFLSIAQKSLDRSFSVG